MNTTLNFKVDLRLVAVVLMLVIVAITYLWKPWQAPSAKTITVRGTATVEQAPDQFIFYPIYQDADQAKVTAKGDEVVARIKRLGVKDADIKTVISAAGTTAKGLIYPVPPSELSIYTITITVDKLELAQKITDYLATTGATGQITPQTAFSTSTRAKLDLESRRKAAADAKTKAQAIADQFGAKLGKVVKISEETGSGGIYAVDSATAVANSLKQASSTLQPGTDQFTYSFSVVFELK